MSIVIIMLQIWVVELCKFFLPQFGNVSIFIILKLLLCGLKSY